MSIRFAFRQLAKNPGFTLVAVLTLGLGIGATAAVFGLIQGVLLSPPPYAQPDRLVMVSPVRTDGQPYRGGCTIGDWMEWRQATNSLQTLALYRWTFNFLVLPDGSESLEGMYVTKDYFKVLGLHPLLGREPTESEAASRNSRPSGILLGYDLWHRRFHGDPQIVGKTVRISRNPAPLTVVGVMPPAVRFLPDPNNASEPNYDPDARVDFWFCAVPDESRPRDDGWNIAGRLRDGVEPARAQAELSMITARRIKSDKILEGLGVKVQPLEEVLNREGRRLLVPLMGAVVFVFLIACANVSGLLLARGLNRQQEYAVRSALGAGRGRLFGQALVESVVLALVGSVAGAIFGAQTINVLKAVSGHAVPRLDAVTVGWPILIFGFGAALVAAAIAGLLPAMRASRPDQFHGLKGTRSSAGRAERRLLGGVATVQVALTMALLAGAALLVRSVHNLGQVSPGYQTRNLVAMTVTSMGTNWNEFHLQALERVSTLPGVKQAAFGWGLPLTGNKWDGEMEIVGQPGASKLLDRINLPLRSVTPEYFDAFGIRLVDGRAFRSTDDQKAARVAVVNEALAARYFPKINPLGQKMRFTGETNQIEIVGLMSNTRTEDLSRVAEPEIYFPFWQMGAFSKHLLVKTTGDPRSMIPQIERELRAVEPTAAVEHVKTVEDLRRDSMAARTFATRLLVSFAAVASALALVGIYGVLSLSVGSRTKEIAVRVAVGAQRPQILRMVLTEALRLVVLGLGLGTVIAISLGRLLETFLYGVRPADLATLLGVGLMFTSVALLACWVPARRATRVDPITALRYE